MTYFWTIQEHVPDGLGFRLFGIAHLLWLGGIVLAVLAIALTCRRWKPVRCCKRRESSPRTT